MRCISRSRPRSSNRSGWFTGFSRAIEAWICVRSTTTSRDRISVWSGPVAPRREACSERLVTGLVASRSVSQSRRGLPAAGFASAASCALEILERWLPRGRYPDLTLGLGRTAKSVEGFCETHRLAHEAFLVAQRRGRRIAWHAEVELDALLLRDRAFARSLIANYIAPLDAVLLQTLRTFHGKDWNESATARALKVHRSTVGDRLERIGNLVGRPVSVCRFSLELALRATELLPSGGDSAGTRCQPSNLPDFEPQN